MQSVTYPDLLSPIAIGFLTSVALWATILPIHLILSARRGRPVEWKRVRTHFLYHFLVVGSFAAPSWFFALTMAAIAALGGIEFLRLWKGEGVDVVPQQPFRHLFYLASALLPLTLYCAPSALNLYLFSLFSLLFVAIVVRQWVDGSLFYLGLLALYLVLLALFFSLVSLRMGKDGFALCYFVFVTATLADDFAYSLGPHVGSRLFARAVSPNKKVVVLLLCYPLTGLAALLFRSLFFSHWSIAHAVALSCAATAGAQLGDFAFSLLKRNRGLKDFGDILPGVGGLWDAMDSLVFSSAAAMLLTNNI